MAVGHRSAMLRVLGLPNGPTPMRHFLAALCVALCLCSCRQRTSFENYSNAGIVSDESIEHGAVPTLPMSFEMMRDPDRRRTFFQELISSSGNQCRMVTRAVLTEALDETDLWKVTCADSGQWIVTFTRDYPPEISSCTKQKQECS